LSLQSRDNGLQEILNKVENGSELLLVQVPGNGEPRLTQTNLHICACQLRELISLSERSFTEKISSKDHILFTRLEKGSALLDKITQSVLEECLGRTGAALVDQRTSEKPSPLRYGKVIDTLQESMGSGAELIKRAISKALYQELRSNPGALKDEQP
jgi:hypothetical protein